MWMKGEVSPRKESLLSWAIRIITCHELWLQTSGGGSEGGGLVTGFWAQGWAGY